MIRSEENGRNLDPRVTELHCIMPIANIRSVMQHGILCHESAARLDHHSVALPEVQDKRDQKSVPNGLPLHQYANLYFHARNPMLYKRREEANDLCVLRVSTDVLALPGTVITDQNAASNYVRFIHPSQWQLLDFDDIYALDWRHPDDQVAQWRHSSRKCAEVLVRDRVPPHYIAGAYVAGAFAQGKLAAAGFALPMIVNPVLFFA